MRFVQIPQLCVQHLVADCRPRLQAPEDKALSLPCRAQLHGSADAHAAQPARADRIHDASTSASKPGGQRGGEAMQKLIRQKTSGGRVQLPPTMQQGMTAVSAPLSPNLLAEPYK